MNLRAADASEMKCILVADDEPNLRLLVRATFRDADCRVVEAEDGPSALRAARRERPDVVLLDWMFPGMTGLDVARAFKLDPEIANIPIVMVSARGQVRDREEGLAAGATAYFTKPFSPADLYNKIRSLWDGGDN